MSVILLGCKKDKKIRCELLVPGYDYTGIGNSKSEKSAEKAATKDFILFLVSQNLLPPIPRVIIILKYLLIKCINIIDKHLFY